MTQEQQDEIINLIKEKLKISISVKEYGLKTHTIRVDLSIDNETGFAYDYDDLEERYYND